MVTYKKKTLNQITESENNVFILFEYAYTSFENRLSIADASW